MVVLFHVVLLIRQINRSSQPPPALGHLGVTKAHQVPHALSAGKQKELFESGPPFPTRQLPIYAEQLKNSPPARMYKNKKFQAWLIPWCSPPFGAWDALAVAKASFVGFGPFGRYFASACTHLFRVGYRVRVSADSPMG